MSITASVSCLMCVVTIGCVACLKLYKYFTFRLASYQVLSSMLFSVSMIVQLVLKQKKVEESDQIICQLAGFMIEYSIWVKLLFTLCLTLHFLFVGVFMKTLVRLEQVYVLTSLLFPILFVWIPFTNNTYGEAGAWCWIKDWKNNCAEKKFTDGIIEQFALWYVPVFITLTISIAVVIVILVIIARREYSRSKINSETISLLQSNHDNTAQHNKRALKQMLPLLAYPVIFYMLFLVPLADRIYDAMSHRVNYPLALTHSISIGAWGFFSSLALLMHVLLRTKEMSQSTSLNINIFARHP